MENLYEHIGYIGWTEDAALLACAINEKHGEKRKQYALCKDGAGLPAYVTAVSSGEELAAACKVLVLTDDGDPADLEKIHPYITTGSICGDFTLALPTEKYRRAKEWEARGGFYVDVASEKPLQAMVKEEKPYFFLAGRCAQLIYRTFLPLVFPVYVPGEVGEATLMGMLRTTPTDTLTELLRYAAHFRETCPAPEIPSLISDVPENQGVANALKRAKQMSDAVWQPVKPFPKLIGYKLTDDFSPAFPVVGFPYSSARVGETFIGVNIPFEGFFTAVEDENSIVYTKDRRNDGNAAAWYGAVCSAFVGYALDLPTRAACRNWGKVPGMRLVEPTAVDSLKLGDMIVNKRHIIIITGIDRTADGKIYQVEISESTPPVCRRKLWRADEVDAYYLQAAGCVIYRYDFIADIPYTPCPYTPLEGETLTPDRNEDLFMLLGNRVNCNFGEELTFHIKTDGWETLQIRCKGKVVSQLPLSKEAQFVTYTPAECGDYAAICVKDQGVSKAAEFTVIRPSVSTDKSVYAPGETIAVTANDGSGAQAISVALVESAASITAYMHHLTPEEQKTGKFTLSWDVPGEYSVRVFFRNQNGLYRVNHKVTIA